MMQGASIIKRAMTNGKKHEGSHPLMVKAVLEICEVESEQIFVCS